MRLIDADKLLKQLEFCIANTEGIEAHKDYNFSYKRCKRFIQEQPTAYDIDKVMEELETYKAKHIGSDGHYISIINNAIEIVEAGGIDEN